MAKKKIGMRDVFDDMEQAELEQIKVTRRLGIQLTQVQWINPNDLTVNPLNKAFFPRETAEYFQRLRDDIRERGILVPLIAKNNRMLLAGENRLRVARELELPTVPVQFVIGDLSPEKERELLLKDNVLRRQLTARQKEDLIRKLYGTELDHDFRGKTGGSFGGEPRSGEEDAFIPLPLRIEHETGITAGTAKRLLAKIRKEMRGEQKPPATPVSRAERHLKALESLAESHPEVIEELLRLLSASRARLKKLKTG